MKTTKNRRLVLIGLVGLNLCVLPLLQAAPIWLTFNGACTETEYACVGTEGNCRKRTGTNMNCMTGGNGECEVNECVWNEWEDCSCPQ